MKSKLVLWGSNPEGEKVLLGLSLNEDSKMVDIYIFQQPLITEELEKQLHQGWKAGDEVNFPEGVKKVSKELSLVGELIPDGYKAERDDLVKRAQTEWHFVILSSRLYKSYVGELEEIKDRIAAASAYTNQHWDDLKGFWDKVQSQIVEKNLFRDHSNDLRAMTNELFTKLKEMRKEMDKVFHDTSKSNFESFGQKLQDIEEKITNGLSLHVIFEELKKLQREYKDLKLTKDHRNKLWDRLDKSFKEVKEKRFGEKGGKEGSPVARLDKRMKGLLDAIQKMERSIKRDKQERDQQEKGSAGAFGQLELQLREARMKMIDERIASKDAKLQDMLKTKDELERKKKSIEEKIKKEKELEEAKKLAEAKIAAEIKEAAESRKDEEEKLEKLAAEIAIPVAQPKSGVKTDDTESGSEEE